MRLLEAAGTHVSRVSNSSASATLGVPRRPGSGLRERGVVAAARQSQEKQLTTQIQIVRALTNARSK